MARPDRKPATVTTPKAAQTRGESSNKSGSMSTGDASAAGPHASTSVSQLSPVMRWLISAAITYHVCAVFIGAWNGAPPTSPFSRAAQEPFAAYIGMMDLNHGYRFFAPDPGPSHLLRYQLTFADGTTADGIVADDGAANGANANGATANGAAGQGRVPDRVRHWPRLLYHRHFMLTEQLGAGRNDEASATMFRSYAAQLLRSSGAESVHVEYVEHTVASPAEYLDGRALDADPSYRVLEQLELKRSEIAAESRGAESL